MVKLIDLLHAIDSEFSLESTLEREDRQIRIWGEENQKKIHNSKVLVLGEGLTAEKVLAGLAGLGIGNILVMGRADFTENDSFLTFDSFKNKYKTRQFTEAIKKINPYVNVRGVKSIFCKALLDYFEFYPQVIVDVTNDEFLKRKPLEYVCNSRKNIMLISAYADSKRAFVSRFDKNKSNYEDILNNEGISEASLEGGAISGIAAGVILEELRKHFFRLSDSDRLLEKRFEYFLFQEENQNLINETDESFEKILKQKKCLVVGAGGIGTYAALDLALEGFKRVDILDYDRISETNLNRQILFYDRIGDFKARVLSKRIKKIKRIKSKAFFREKYKIDVGSERFFEKNNYDIIFGCLDNIRARYILNEIALKHNLIYIDGATSPFRGSVVSYAPGKSSCVACNRNLKLVEEVRRSCNDADPSVVMSNMVIGGIMTGEALNILKGHPPKRIVYNSNHNSRIYSEPQFPSRPECRCYKN